MNRIDSIRFDYSLIPVSISRLHTFHSPLIQISNIRDFPSLLSVCVERGPGNRRSPNGQSEARSGTDEPPTEKRHEDTVVAT
jgi:hypothetical protein